MDIPASDPFVVLELPHSFDIDEELLNQKYQEQQLKFHPDRFVNASAEEKAKAAEQAVAITQAYEDLGKPVSRLQILLRLLDLDAEGEKTPDPEFLEDVMSVKEAMAACCAGDSPDQEGLCAIYEITAERLEDCYDTLEEIFQDLLVEGPEVGRLLLGMDMPESREARSILVSLYQEFIYWDKTLQELEDMIEEE